ncbi:MAG: choice-of-anchor J domain-containing protein [Saprospiraceae bacterium]|nr:choice-of-anchor J domain-containing protein [Saprospiraceae bacterium]
MRLLFTIVLVFGYSLIFSQNIFNAENLFRVKNNPVSRAEDFVSDAVFMEINSGLLSDLVRTEAGNLKLSIPISKNEVTEMTLEKFQVFSDDFVLRTSGGDTITSYKKPVFYRGKLKNYNGYATVSISDEELIGIVSINNRGDFNVGKLKSTQFSYIVYNDNFVKVDMGIHCSVDDNPVLDRSSAKRNDNITGLRTNCVKFYLEGDYALYQDKGTVSNTASYMSGLFAQMASLFSIESINIEIKEIKIWTSPDNYPTNNSFNALSQFIANNPSINADLGHLFALGGQGTGGVAWLDVLCDPGYNFAYSNISSSYNNVPTYSWSVEVITHETGHNLGSRHTHACVWNGNNTQIDDCGNKYFYDNGTPLIDIEGNPCYVPATPILPASGSIMSYCHLLSGIGIDFNNGFGIQPGNLIRSKVNSAPCLSDCASSSTCFIPVNVITGAMNGSSVNLDWEIGQGGSKWQIQYGLSGFTLGTGSTISNITTTSYTLTGLEIGSTYDWYIRTDCSNGNYSSWVGKITFTVLCSEPAVMQLPYFEGWENNNGIKVTDGTFMCTYNQVWSFDTDHPGEGRVRWGTQCPSDFRITGDGSLLLDRNFLGANTINYSTLELDLSDYSNSDDLFFNFSFKDIGDETNPNDKVWMRGNEFEGWIVAYDIQPGSKTNFQTYNVSLDLDSLLNLDGQVPGSTFQIRFGQEDNASAQFSGGDGIVYDNVEIFDCGRKLIPYSTDFTDAECWKVVNNNNDAYTWKLNTGNSCDTKYFGLEYNGPVNPSVSMDDWLFSPGFYMTAGASYQVSFSTGDASQIEKLEVFLSSDNSVSTALTGTLIFKDESINNSTCDYSVIEFVSPSEGYYFFGFHGYSNANTTHNLYIDDFSIEESPGLLGLTIESNTNNTCDYYTVNGVAGDIWHHLYSPSGKIVASINPNDQVLGQVFVEMRDGGNVETYNINGTNAKSIPRYFNFDNENFFANPVTVRLYFNNAELNEYNITAPMTNDLISSLQINHYDGINEDCNFANNAGTGTIIVPGSITTGTVGISDHFMQIDVNQFSEFLIHKAVNSGLGIRPELSGKSGSGGNEITVSISDYYNIHSMVLQRKSTATAWSDLMNIDIKQGILKYSLIDKNPFSESYYRIELNDDEGSKSYSNVISIVSYESSYDVFVFPNPAKEQFFLQFNYPFQDVVEIGVYNILGSKIYSESINSKKPDLKHMMELKNLANGIYYLNIRIGNDHIVKKIVIDK